MSRPNQSDWSSSIRFWVWRSAMGNSADRSRHLSTNVVTPSLKRTDDPPSNPSREARELFNLGLVRPWRMARDAVKVARDARIAERRATKLAVEARQAAALAAAQAAEVAAREAALKAEQAARDAEFAEQTAREAALEAERQGARDARYAARKLRKRKGR